MSTHYWKLVIPNTPLQLFKRVLVVALLAAAVVCLSRASTPAVQDNAALWRPRYATPAIVALDNDTNREFVAEVKAPSSATGWQATLTNDLRSWPCQVVSATYAKINRETEPGWQIKVRVPSDISPELFDLVVASSQSVSAQNQCVSISPAFATNFYLLHITDEQIVNQYHTDPSGQYYKMVGTWEEMKWMQEPVNLINPRFVLITGDQIDFNGALDGWNNWANWGYTPKGKKTFTEEETTQLETRLSDMYKDCHKGYHVAYAEMPGNHDVTPPGKLLLGSKINWHPISARFYETQFGQRTYSFRMGDFYVLMHDWSDAGLRDWATKDYEAASQDPGVKYRLIGQHYHAKWDGAKTGNAAFMPSTCDLMLIGHGHTEKTIQTSPFYIYEDGPSFRYGMTGFFNFRRTSGGWTCDQTAAPRNYTNDVWPLFTDNGAVKKVRTDQPDSRNITAKSVTITNDLPQNFYDGRVRFVLPEGVYRTVKNGEILSEYDSSDKTKTAVLVRVNIPAKDTITVSVSSGSN
ncbi:MAG TPA: hypothetical protein VG938_09085 [Verrucomicrobiae bacterium]|jgi:hypothetical protein|nr:hypothetical protein [Verrucomicrobiae bacterium]